MSPQSSLQHTLYIWPHGLFPRRLSYYLLASGLVPDTNALLAGKTASPNLRIVIITLNPTTFAWESADPDYPKPQGKSFPSLMITDPTSLSPPRWIHESNSIMLYLEANCASFANVRTRPMLGTDPIDRAVANDLLCACNEAILWHGLDVRHTWPSSLSWSGMTKEQQSVGAAEDGLRMAQKTLAKMQEWASQSLKQSGWLTPGLKDGPGLVDAALLGWSRYLFTSYGLDGFAFDGLDALREWRSKIESVGWFKEYERDERVQTPAFLKFKKSST